MDAAVAAHVRKRFREFVVLVDEPAGEQAPPASPQEMIERAEREVGNYVLQLRTGLVLHAIDDAAGAERFLVRARDLFPEYAGADGPYWHLAQLYREGGQSDRGSPPIHDRR